MGDMSGATAAKTRLALYRDGTRDGLPVKRQPAIRSLSNKRLSCRSSAVLPPPGEQVGREIGRWPLFARRPGRDRAQIRIRRNYFAIEVPGRVTEQRDNDSKPEEERDRSCHQQRSHDQ